MSLYCKIETRHRDNQYQRYELTTCGAHAKDIIPMRLNAMMILNQPAWFTVVLSLVKPFLSKKLRKRIYLLKHDYQRFHSLIDPAVLPTCFKGSVDWGPIREKE